jgi:hypothetical protein
MDVMDFWRSCHLACSQRDTTRARKPLFCTLSIQFSEDATYSSGAYRFLCTVTTLLVRADCFFVVYVSSQVFCYNFRVSLLTFFCNSVGLADTSFFLFTSLSVLTLTDCET